MNTISAENLIVGWGSEQIERYDFPVKYVRMSSNLKKMDALILNYDKCRYLYQNLPFDSTKQACAYSLDDTKTSLIIVFISFNDLKMFVKKISENLVFSYILQGDAGNPFVMGDTLFGIVTEVTTRLLLLATLVVKVSAFEDYIRQAMKRLITNQNSQSRKRFNEQCDDINIKLNKFDHFFL